ncbi:universal stress protein UspA [Tistrella bauzanensis]|uniref:Universal stress protein UspA n=1 Tax=Tistrella bauzanensis TaxID=657419 RepID=A0ABQ1J5E7_9PROT|nr:universal stress protein [Tistrella bauzanensis]GGB60237.1 universal stress protein UspA [Tistrella bauzanensis]
MTRLLALIDGSAYADSVCDHAAWVAARTGASIDVMHVLGRREAGGSANLSGSLTMDAREILLAELADLDEKKARVARKLGRAVVDQAVARLKADGIAEVTPRLRSGDLIEAVAEVEPDTDLILIGKRGEAADFARLHLGSNLERVVRAARRPVLVAARAFRPVNRFLIAFDGGTSAMKAVNHIAAGKLFTGLDCHLLMVGNPNSDARARFDNAVQTLRQHDYAVTADILAGEADAVIADHVASHGIDLLVMGAYGHSRIRTLIIGSTTAEMVRSCLVPVMLFR